MEGRNEFVREIEVNIDPKTECCLKIHQHEVGGVGCVVWDAALVLLKFLFTEKGRNYVQDKIVLELGSGTGAVGIGASVAGAKCVVITDLPDLLPLLSRNIEENLPLIERNKTNPVGIENVSDFVKLKAELYRWGNDDDRMKIFGDFHSNSQEVDCVLIADCIYYEDGILDLFQAINNILSQYPSAIILCSYEFRTTGNKPKLLKSFIKLLNTADINLELSYVDIEDMDPVYRSDDIKILLIKCV